MKVKVHQFSGPTSVSALPLAAGQIVAAAKADPLLARQCEFEITMDREPIEEIVARYEDPSVVGFSCYPWNIRYSMAVALQLKRRFPSCFVVLGGPSSPQSEGTASALLEQNDTVDAIVIGEGELTFRELLRARLHGTDLEEVPGVVFARRSSADREIVSTAARARISDFSECPSPYLDGTFDELFTRNRGSLGGVLIETNRGCPFTCTFCVWGRKQLQRVYELPMERVQGELRWIAERKIGYVYVVDANFGLRKRDIEIARALVEQRRASGHRLTCYINLTKNPSEKSLEIFEIFRDAGIGCQVELSVQDFDRDVLQAVERSNISYETSLNLRKAAQERGLPTYNELILGLPQQSYDSFCDSLIQALTPYPGDACFLYLCRVVENSKMATLEQRKQFGLRTQTCILEYRATMGSAPHVEEHEEIVIATSTMPEEDWRRAYELGHLLTASHSMKLLDVLVKFLRFGLQVDVKSYFELLASAASAPPGELGDEGVLVSMGRVLADYVSSIRKGGPIMLPLQGGGVRFKAREALVITALRHYDSFIAEVAELTRSFLLQKGILDSEASSSNLLSELFEFQRFATPTFERGQESGRTFDHDWLAYRNSGGHGGSPELRRVRLDYHPPRYLEWAVDFDSFASSHVAALYTNRGLAKVLDYAETDEV